jgi:hypothetical protein
MEKRKNPESRSRFNRISFGCKDAITCAAECNCMPGVSEKGVHKEKPNPNRAPPNGFASRKARKSCEIESSSRILPAGGQEALSLIN